MSSEPQAGPIPPRRPLFFTSAGCGIVAILGIALAVVSYCYMVHYVYEDVGVRSVPNRVQPILDRQVEAWNRGDLDGFMAGYWNSEGLRFYSGGTVTTGWNATLDRYRKKYKSEGKEMGTLTFSDVEIQPQGQDAAFVRGRWKVVTSRDTFEGLFTLIVRDIAGQGWRIVHDHTSG